MDQPVIDAGEDCRGNGPHREDRSPNGIDRDAEETGQVKGREAGVGESGKAGNDSALCRRLQDAVERIGAGQAVEADFEVIDNLKQIGVKIPPKIKSAAFLLKQTNGESVENAE